MLGLRRSNGSLTWRGNSTSCVWSVSCEMASNGIVSWLAFAIVALGGLGLSASTYPEQERLVLMLSWLARTPVVVLRLRKHHLEASVQDAASHPCPWFLWRARVLASIIDIIEFGCC